MLCVRHDVAHSGRKRTQGVKVEPREIAHEGKRPRFPIVKNARIIGKKTTDKLRLCACGMVKGPPVVEDRRDAQGLARI